jgi:hypothetical protein
MGNRFGRGGSGEDGSMARSRYKYMSIDLYSSHSPIYLSFFRLSRAWIPVIGISLVTLVLSGIAVVIILSLIPLYLPSKGYSFLANTGNNQYTDYN